jgi:hypothetical protein
MTTFKSQRHPRHHRLAPTLLVGALALGCSGGPGQEAEDLGSTAAAVRGATPGGIAGIALANRGKGACSTNSRGGRGFGGEYDPHASCTGNGGSPEYWCADFARWVWRTAGVADTGELNAAAGSFYVYGHNHGTLKDTPEVGDAVVFDYQGDGVAEHVAIVTKVNADGTIETLSGDWGGHGNSEAAFSSTSHAILNEPAYKGKVGDYPAEMGMRISGFIRPMGLEKPKPTPVPPPPTACGIIEPGHGLKVGKSLKSCDGRFDLAMESSGDLVWRGPPGVLWSTHPKEKGYVAVMQTDGNFVEYDADSKALWASDTSKHHGDHLALQEDGNLVVYDTAGKALWSSHTDLPHAPSPPTGCGVIKAGEGLTVGGSVSACGDAYTLLMQTDGNLVLYQNNPKKPLWATGTKGKDGFNAIMRADGDFVLYDIHDKMIWQSDTANHPGADLAVQAEGNLVVYEDVACDGGTDCEAALWISNAAGK